MKKKDESFHHSDSTESPPQQSQTIADRKSSVNDKPNYAEDRKSSVGERKNSTAEADSTLELIIVDSSSHHQRTSTQSDIASPLSVAISSPHSPQQALHNASALHNTTSPALSSSSPTQPLSPISNNQKWDELAEAERELCDQLSAIESTPVHRGLARQSSNSSSVGANNEQEVKQECNSNVNTGFTSANDSSGNLEIPQINVSSDDIPFPSPPGEDDMSSQPGITLSNPFSLESPRLEKSPKNSTGSISINNFSSNINNNTLSSSSISACDISSEKIDLATGSVIEKDQQNDNIESDNSANALTVSFPHQDSTAGGYQSISLVTTGQFPQISQDMSSPSSSTTPRYQQLTPLSARNSSSGSACSSNRESIDLSTLDDLLNEVNSRTSSCESLKASPDKKVGRIN